jgi:hypothetical protein
LQSVHRLDLVERFGAEVGFERVHAVSRKLNRVLSNIVLILLFRIHQIGSGTHLD